MSFVQDKTIGLGEAVSGAFGVLGTAKREIGLYFLVFGVLSGLQSAAYALFEPLLPIIALITFILYFYGQYRLYQVLLSRAGVAVEPVVRSFSFLGMAMVVGIGLSFASNFFIIPAIILGAKWVMAPSYLVAQKGGIFAAMGASWNASNGSTVQLSLAFAIVFFVWVILLGVIGAITEVSNLAVGYNLFTAMAIYVLPIMMMGLSVAAYCRLNDGVDDIAEVFV